MCVLQTKVLTPTDFPRHVEAGGIAQPWSPTQGPVHLTGTPGVGFYVPSVLRLVDFKVLTQDGLTTLAEITAVPG